MNEKMRELGANRSAIRELFEYGKRRKAEIGAENVYDFSIGNPSVPAPDCVNEAIKRELETENSVSVHGYTSAAGDIKTRRAVAEYLEQEKAAVAHQQDYLGELTPFRRG